LLNNSVPRSSHRISFKIIDYNFSEEDVESIIFL